MRPAVLQAYSTMLPRLEAEQAQAHIAQIAAGSGTMAERDQRSYLKALKRAANGGRSEPVRKATVASLAGIGIKIATVEGEGSRQEFLTAGALATAKKK